MTMEFRALEDVELRVADDDEGSFDGVACRFNVVDSYGTTFHPGAFTKTGLRGSYALLFMHDPSRPIGTFRAEERGDHLHITGRYDDTQAGRDARAMARSGSAPELSVGFVRTDLPSAAKLAEMTEEQVADRLAHIRGARLVETSQITARMAAVPGSKLKTVRDALGALYAEEQPDDLATQVRAERERQAAEQHTALGRRRAAARLRLVAAGDER